MSLEPTRISSIYCTGNICRAAGTIRHFTERHQRGKREHQPLALNQMTLMCTFEISLGHEKDLISSGLISVFCILASEFFYFCKQSRCGATEKINTSSYYYSYPRNNEKHIIFMYTILSHKEKSIPFTK